MHILKLLKKRIYILNKKEIFLIGFYISFLIVMTLAMLIDFMIENNIDAYVEIIFIFLTLMSIFYYNKSKKLDIAVYSIVIIATFTTYALLISNHFNISIFHTIVPLGYFLLFSLKRSLWYTFFHQMIVVSIYWCGHKLYPKNVLLHDATILTAIALASLMIVFFGIVYHLSVENSYQLLRKSDRQKELLLKEVHHRVKNNLNIISSMLGLQMLREDDHLKEIFEKNRLRIDSIAMVHEILYKHSDFEKINVYEYLSQLSSMIVDMSESNAEVNIGNKTLFLPFEMILKIGIISNELIVNSIKYAFIKNKGMIEIQVEEYQLYYLYTYKDSSTQKIDLEQIGNKKSLGLKLINMMVEQMESIVDIESNSGLVYRIKVPKNV